VIGRYSVLPFYRELEADLATKNSRLINSYREHRWIADFDWYEPLREFTPRSWFERDFYKCDINGPFVLKGLTNSRKQQWSTHMFAKDRAAAMEVAGRLANDSLIGSQGIVYRENVPLKLIERDPIYHLPFVNEWRFFFYKATLLCFGYYWTNCQWPERFKITPEAIELAHKCAEICASFVNFFVLDLAQTAEGNWILIEVNDGGMSGLSNNNSSELYSNLGGALSAP